MWPEYVPAYFLPGNSIIAVPSPNGPPNGITAYPQPQVPSANVILRRVVSGACASPTDPFLGWRSTVGEANGARPAWRCRLLTLDL